MADQPSVGFIGLGIMGRPMALNLLKAGFPLTVYDLLPQPVAELVGAGARAADSPAALAAAVEVVLLCLPDSPDVQAALRGPTGVLAGTKAGQIIVDMSTISPMAARELAAEAAAKGAIFLDAPVSGGQVGAVQGTLSIMVGGDAAAFAQVRPVLAALGKTILHIGESGAGQVAKACNQIIIAVTIEAVAEALVLAAKAGVDPAQVRQALLGGYAYSRVLEGHGERFLARNFTPGFRTRLQYKDLNIAVDAGRAYGAPLPATALVHQLYGALMATGAADLDHSYLVTLLEGLAGGTLAGDGRAGAREVERKTYGQ
ncbi:MAG TPA: 2-hydroxy-3-oxopropionate reductase [Caldilineaceae bacterium]|nr:2-hydroxy-3-oxopropionate reductase [Caldilineaceae bacterium]